MSAGRGDGYNGGMPEAAERHSPVETLATGADVRAYAEAALEAGGADLDHVRLIATALGVSALAAATGIPRDRLCAAFRDGPRAAGEPTPRDLLLAVACGALPRRNR